MTSIRRFYSNAYTDAEKQDAINLFLGNFVPQHGHAALWELDSDYFLHAGTASWEHTCQREALAVFAFFVELGGPKLAAETQRCNHVFCHVLS